MECSYYSLIVTFIFGKSLYNEEVNKYQEELNKLEPKEQVNKTGLIVKKYIIRK